MKKKMFKSSFGDFMQGILFLDKEELTVRGNDTLDVSVHVVSSGTLEVQQIKEMSGAMTSKFFPVHPGDHVMKAFIPSKGVFRISGEDVLGNPHVVILSISRDGIQII